MSDKIMEFIAFKVISTPLILYRVLNSLCLQYETGKFIVTMCP